MEDLRRLEASGETGASGEPDDRGLVHRYGLALWDVFSNNNEVVDGVGVCYDLGSFRGSAGEIARLLEAAYPAVGDFEPLDFYMGSMGEEDDTVRRAHRDIFERIRALGGDWVSDVPHPLIDRSPVLVAYLDVFEKATCPIPSADPAPIDLDAYMAFTPEKLELFGGYLIDEKDRVEARLELLSLLLTNVGLRTAMRLAPVDAWREVLDSMAGRERPRADGPPISPS